MNMIVSFLIISILLQNVIAKISERFFSHILYRTYAMIRLMALCHAFDRFESIVRFLLNDRQTIKLRPLHKIQEEKE